MFFFKNKLRLVILFTVIFSLSANATLVVTSIRTIGNASPYVKSYEVTWKRISGPKDNEIIPNYVTDYGAMEEHDFVSFACSWGGSSSNPTLCVPAMGGRETWSDVEDRWIRTYGATGPGTVGHMGRADSRECVMFAGQSGQTAPIGQQVNNGPLICVGAPPLPDPRCFLSENPILEFNILAGQPVSNMSIEKTINFSCSFNANVTIINPELKSDVDFGWGKVDITINNTPLPYTMTNVKNKSLFIKGVLNGIAPSAGVFEKNMILIIAYD